MQHRLVYPPNSSARVRAACNHPATLQRTETRERRLQNSSHSKKNNRGRKTLAEVSIQGGHPGPRCSRWPLPPLCFLTSKIGKIHFIAPPGSGRWVNGAATVAQNAAVKAARHTPAPRRVTRARRSDITATGGRLCGSIGHVRFQLIILRERKPVRVRKARACSVEGREGNCWPAALRAAGMGDSSRRARDSFHWRQESKGSMRDSVLPFRGQAWYVQGAQVDGRSGRAAKRRAAVISAAHGSPILEWRGAN